MIEAKMIDKKLSIINTAQRIGFILLTALRKLLFGFWKSNKENSLFVIFPYKAEGTWVFDDLKRGLVMEPFVLGVPEMIDNLVAAVNITSNKVRFTFSRNPFPQYHGFLKKESEEMGGAWYGVGECKIGELHGYGWFCPATLLYLRNFPSQIYFRIESV